MPQGVSLDVTSVQEFIPGNIFKRNSSLMFNGNSSGLFWLMYSGEFHFDQPLFHRMEPRGALFVAQEYTNGIRSNIPNKKKHPKLRK